MAWRKRKGERFYISSMIRDCRRMPRKRQECLNRIRTRLACRGERAYVARVEPGRLRIAPVAFEDVDVRWEEYTPGSVLGRTLFTRLVNGTVEWDDDVARGDDVFERLRTLLMHSANRLAKTQEIRPDVLSLLGRALFFRFREIEALCRKQTSPRSHRRPPIGWAVSVGRRMPPQPVAGWIRHLTVTSSPSQMEETRNFSDGLANSPKVMCLRISRLCCWVPNRVGIFGNSLLIGGHSISPTFRWGCSVRCTRISAGTGRRKKRFQRVFTTLLGISQSHCWMRHFMV